MRAVCRALPNSLALATMIFFAHAADEAHRLQPEPVSLHIYGTLILGVAAWGITRGLLWLWGR